MKVLVVSSRNDITSFKPVFESDYVVVQEENRYMLLKARNGSALDVWHEGKFTEEKLAG